MKLALLLAGQPRFYRRCFGTNQANLFQGREFDVFLHAWHDPETAGGDYRACSGHGGGPIEADPEPGLLELYQPKRHLVQKQVRFEMEGFHVDGNPGNPHLIGNFSWPYAFRQAARLCWDWELEHDFTYDRVVLMRYDLEFEARVPVEELDPGSMHTIDTGLGLSFALCDQFFVSGSGPMKTLSGLYEYMHQSFRQRNQFNTERNSYDLMRAQGIPLSLLSLPYHIVRG